MKAWFRNLAEREQRLVLVGVAVVGLALLWLLWIEPLHRARSLAMQAARDQASLLRLVESVSRQVLTYRIRRQERGFDGSLLQLIDESGRHAGISGAVRNITPNSADEVQIQLQQVGFDTAIQWIMELETGPGIRVTQLSVRRTDQPGRVDLGLTFRR